MCGSVACSRYAKALHKHGRVQQPSLSVTLYFDAMQYSLVFSMRSQEKYATHSVVGMVLWRSQGVSAVGQQQSRGK